MKKTRTRKTFDFTYEKRTIPASLIDAETDVAGWDKKELKARAAYFLLNGVPEFSVNEQENGRFKLLAADKDSYAAKFSGV